MYEAPNLCLCSTQEPTRALSLLFNLVSEPSCSVMVPVGTIKRERGREHGGLISVGGDGGNIAGMRRWKMRFFFLGGGGGGESIIKKEEEGRRKNTKDS